MMQENATGSTRAMTFELFPPVKKIRMRKSIFSLKSRRYIALSNPCCDHLIASIKRFQSLLPFETEITYGKPETGSTLLWINNPAMAARNTQGTSSQGLGAEGIESYQLLCQPDTLTISAATEKAIHCGLQTLAQIVEDIQWRSKKQTWGEGCGGAEHPDRNVFFL